MSYCIVSVLNGSAVQWWGSEARVRPVQPGRRSGSGKRKKSYKELLRCGSRYRD